MNFETLVKLFEENSDIVSKTGKMTQYDYTGKRLTCMIEVNYFENPKTKEVEIFRAESHINPQLSELAVVSNYKKKQKYYTNAPVLFEDNINKELNLKEDYVGSFKLLLEEFLDEGNYNLYFVGKEKLFAIVTRSDDRETFAPVKEVITELRELIHSALKNPPFYNNSPNRRDESEVVVDIKETINKLEELLGIGTLTREVRSMMRDCINKDNPKSSNEIAVDIEVKPLDIF